MQEQYRFSKVCLCICLVSLAFSCTDSAPLPLRLDAVDPSGGTTLSAIEVQILGDNFFKAVDRDLSSGDEFVIDDHFIARLRLAQGTEVILEEITYESRTALKARIPAGIQPGSYELWLTSPTGLEAHLSQAYLATDKPPPELTSVTPADVVNDALTAILLKGARFEAGLTVQLDATGLQVQSVQPTEAEATIPVGFPTGTYSVAVANPDGQQARLADAVTIHDPALLQASFAAAPATVRVGEVIALELTLKNGGGTKALELTVGSLTISPAGLVALESAPTAGPFELAPDEERIFSWSYRASVPGSVSFQATATAKNEYSARPIQIGPSQADCKIIACSSSADCQNPKPICVSSVCVACKTDAECQARDPGLPQCAAGECRAAECSSSADCQNPKPICVSSVCVPCQTDAECQARDPTLPRCTGGACSPDTCAQDSDCVAWGLGEICLPECAPDPKGCIRKNSQIQLSCQEGVPNPGCNLTLQGGTNTGQADCLTCTSEVGLFALADSDFRNDQGVCSLDGWQMVSGSACADTLAGCNPTSQNACCTDFGTICSTAPFGTPTLRTDMATNCGSGLFKEWRLTRTFNTTGVTNLLVCVEYAEKGASINEGLLVFASDAAHPLPQEAPLCLKDGPYLSDADNLFARRCAPLPAWAGSNPALTLTVAMHSDSAGRILFLRRIELLGWGGGCSPQSVTVFSNGFQSSANPSACDTSAWIVTGGGATCVNAPFTCNGSALLTVEASSVTLERRNINASALDTNVVLCFQTGSHSANGGEAIVVSVDAGQGFQEVFRKEGKQGKQEMCHETCLKLSDLLPAVIHNPSIGLRFSLTSDAADDKLVLDNVVLSGARNCDGGAAISIGPLSEGPPGQYAFHPTHSAGGPLAAKLTCTWDPNTALSAEAEITFAP